MPDSKFISISRCYRVHGENDEFRGSDKPIQRPAKKKLRLRNFLPKWAFSDCRRPSPAASSTLKQEIKDPEPLLLIDPQIVPLSPLGHEIEPKRGVPRVYLSTAELELTWLSLLESVPGKKGKRQGIIFRAWLRLMRRVIESKSSVSEQRGPMLEMYIDVVRARCGDPREWEKLIRSGEACPFHETTGCYCHAFEHDGENVYYDIKAHVQRRVMEFF